MRIKRGAVVVMAATALTGLALPAHAGGTIGNGIDGNGDGAPMGITEGQCRDGGGTVNGGSCDYPDGSSEPIAG